MGKMARRTGRASVHMLDQIKVDYYGTHTPVSRQQLLQQAWGFDFYGETRTVDVHIAHLRKKLAGCRTTIETVTGIGYKLAAG